MRLVHRSSIVHGLLAIAFASSGLAQRAPNRAAASPTAPMSDAEIAALAAQLVGPQSASAMMRLSSAGVRAAHAVLPYLRDPDPTVRWHAIGIVRRYTSRGASGLNTRGVRDTLATALAREGAGETRVALYEALREVAPDARTTPDTSERFADALLAKLDSAARGSLTYSGAEVDSLGVTLTKLLVFSPGSLSGIESSIERPTSDAVDRDRFYGRDSVLAAAVTVASKRGDRRTRSLARRILVSLLAAERHGPSRTNMGARVSASLGVAAADSGAEILVSRATPINREFLSARPKDALEEESLEVSLDEDVAAKRATAIGLGAACAARPRADVVEPLLAWLTDTTALIAAKADTQRPGTSAFTKRYIATLASSVDDLRADAIDALGECGPLSQKALPILFGIVEHANGAASRQRIVPAAQLALPRIRAAR